MKPEILTLFDNYTNAVNVAKKYLDISDLDEASKDCAFYKYDWDFKTLQNAPTSGGVKFFTRDLAHLWSYWLAIWAELFWQEIDARGIHLVRTDMVLKIINRKRFSGVGEAMMYNRNWNNMVALGYLSRYTPGQLAFINELLRKDKEKRLDLLIKSLRNRKVNASEYLKYGEAIAYFTEGKLFSDQIGNDEISYYFGPEELHVLNEIWR